MRDQHERRRLGSYELTRRLDAHPLGERWLALCTRSNTSHLVYELAMCHGKQARRRFIDAIGPVASLDHPHLLHVDEYSFSPDGTPWLIAGYPGDQDGLLTLPRLVEAKGGRLAPSEARRAVIQLLEGLDAAHAAGLNHGPIQGEDVVVDRHGALKIELFGFARLLAGAPMGDREVTRDEVRSVCELAYWLVTGLSADAPRIAASRLVKKLDRHFDAWIERGLDPAGGFDSAVEALEALVGDDGEDVAPVSTSMQRVLGRLRTGSRAG